MFGALAGAAVGGLVSAFNAREARRAASDARAQAQANANITYTSDYGTATPNGYTANVSPEDQARVDLANQKASELMQQGFTMSPEMVQQARDEILALRQPLLERNISQQAQAQGIQDNRRNTVGSSGSVLARAAQEQNANFMRDQLVAQANLGGRDIANQNLNQRINAFNTYDGVRQQQFDNQLRGMNATTNARAQQVSGGMAGMNAGTTAGQAAAKMQNTNMTNIMGGIQAGVNLGNAWSQHNQNNSSSNQGSTQNGYTGDSFNNWVQQERGLR